MRGVPAHARRDRRLGPHDRGRQARRLVAGGETDQSGNAMKHITFHFDVVSPYAYLAFEKLPDALQGLTYSVDYRPVLFAAFLKHHGQLGPAEIEPKRDWTYRQVLWLAHANAIPPQMPAAH